ncbi:chaperone modulator CbpM [Conexibacter woesei]|uniref:chaperone modulator CbpM n=1 Tax=Conexibacter woesei TaxID=191495 RepID=UPI00041E828E|nr:chaperone modulator CbpM [Conexibacter woesei]
MTTTVLEVRAVAVAREPAIERLARESGLHPDVVRRLVGLGLVRPTYSPAAPALLAQAARLRRDLGLDYSAAVLVCELLARIDDLQAQLNRSRPR